MVVPVTLVTEGGAICDVWSTLALEDGQRCILTAFGQGCWLCVPFDCSF